MTAQTAYSDPTPKPQTRSGWVLAAGILFVVIGVFAALEPLVTSLAVGIFLAATFIIAGISATASGLANIRHRGSWLYVILGVLAIAVGVIMARLPLNAAITLVWAIGLWMIAAGVFELAIASRFSLHRGWLIFIGLVDIVLGGLLMWIDPLSALQVLAFLVGFNFVMRGIASIMFSRALRQLSRLSAR
jgi:uncharacterized membrane protein HdeD (DUF308 family)